MEDISIERRTGRTLGGSRRQVIVGVVASGNLEVRAARPGAPAASAVAISPSAEGCGAVGRAGVDDFVERAAPGGVRFSINDGGARPDTVLLRLLQAARALEQA